MSIGLIQKETLIYVIYLKLLERMNIPVKSVISGATFRWRPKPEATQQQIDTANALINGVGNASMSVVDMTITCTMDIANTEAIVTVWGSDGTLDFEDTITVTNGECQYTLETSLPDIYTILIYGTMTYDNDYVYLEVV